MWVEVVPKMSHGKKQVSTTKQMEYETIEQDEPYLQCKSANNVAKNSNGVNNFLLKCGRVAKG